MNENDAVVETGTVVETPQGADAQSAHEEMVPASTYEAERAARQQQDERLAAMENHLSLLAAQKTQPVQQVSEPDYSDDDVLTVGEGRKTAQQIKQEVKGELDELRVAMKYKDYDQVLKKHLPEVLKENPSLKTTLEHDPNRFETAYWMAKRSQSYLESQKSDKVNKDAEKVIKNANRTGNLSAAGHSTGGAPTGLYKQMSDEEFMREANKNLGYL